MNTLPSAVTPYKKTGIFTSDNVPTPFLKEHSTAEGTWGVLNVSKGSLTFCDDEAGKECHLTEASQTVIAPKQKHHLKLNGYVEFYVEFYR